MKSSLDANTCIALLNSDSKAVMTRFAACQPTDIVVCSIVRAELLYGARRSARVESNLKRLEHFFAPLQSAAFDDQCAHYYARIRADLAAQGKPVGANDLLIAAIARAHDLIRHAQHARVQPGGGIEDRRLGDGALAWVARGAEIVLF